MVLLPVAAFLAAYWIYPPDVTLLNPDSASYIDFQAMRSGAYPFFLSLVKAVSPDLAQVPRVQLLLYAVAVLALGWQLARALGSATIAFVVEAALLGNPAVNRYHFMVFTESLFLSVTALFLAALIAHLRAGRLLSLALASMLAGCAIAIRPPGLAFVPVLLLLPFAASRMPPRLRRTLARVAVAILPAILVLSLEVAFYRAHHDGPRQSLAPAHLLAKAGLVEIGAADAAALIENAAPTAKPLQAALESELAAGRRFVAGAPSHAARCRIIDPYEGFLQYRFALEERALAASAGPGALIDAGWQRLRRGLPGYAALTAEHLLCLWSLSAIDDRQNAELARYVESARPPPFSEEVRDNILSTRRPPWSGLVRAAMGLIAALLAAAAIVLIAAIVAGRRPSIALAVAGSCGVLVHGAQLLTAMTGLGIPRYTIGLWVPIALGTAMALVFIYRLASPALQGRSLRRTG